MSLAELTTEQPESTDPGYLAWQEAKIKKALQAAKDHPERRIPQAEMWKKHGLER